MSFGSSVTLITIAFGYFSEKRKKADLIIVFAFCFLWGVDTFFILSEEIGFYQNHPYLLYLNEPFELFLGSLVYYRFRILIEGKMKFNLLTVLLFLPGVLAVIYFIPFFMLGPQEKLACVGFHNIPNGIVRSIYLLIVRGQTPWFVFCVALFIIHGSRILSAKGIALLMQRKVLVVYSLLWIALAITGYTILLLKQSLEIRVMIIVTNYMIVLFYFIERKYDDFFLAMQRDASETRYKRSMVKGINTGAVIERIKELMELESLYLDETLSLQTLSSLLSITPHQLSEILNNLLYTNFRTFVNTYRIDAAKKMLLLKENQSIIRIAFQCGFNSKNAFNTAFHKQEGITPTEFKERHKKMRHDL